MAWRRPTLPRLEAKYHGRWGVSRPSSGWDRVYQPRDGHQATKPDLLFVCERMRVTDLVMIECVE